MKKIIYLLLILLTACSPTLQQRQSLPTPTFNCEVIYENEEVLITKCEK